ncbi:MAG: hypothetical protein J1E04_03720 [Alistipes sp.]|nr:hypothetical protein [Alistipes sp.]
MKNILNKALFVLLLAALSVACKKEDSCSISITESSAFVEEWGQSITLHIKTSNVKTVSASASNAWAASANLSAKTVTVTAPENEEAENAERKTTVTLTAKSAGGATSTATVAVYLVNETVDLSADGTSNCYIVTKPDTRYRFNASRKAETDETLATASVGVVWQSASSEIRYLELDEDGYARFYVEYLTDSDTELREGNALIAAYNSNNEIIWSWHIWLTNSDPRTEESVATYSNGVTFMGRNLGAFGNSDGSDDTAEILASYGLYYQWGRKDPFLRPRYYDCADNSSQLIYNGTGTYTYTHVQETDAQKGTIEYAVANPSTMLVAPGINNGDWFYGGSNAQLWGSKTEKSIYDPCPKGWHVPAGDDFSVLKLADEEDNMDLELAKLIFGWNLTDTGTGEKHFYTGAGYRSYFDGVLSNVNYKDQYPYTPVPWIGYYWTTGTDASNGIAMFFDLNTSRATINAFEPQHFEYRANAMQVRCVKLD